MKNISSRANPFFRSLRQLAWDASARRDAELVLLEGIHLCDAFLARGGVPHATVVGASALDRDDVVLLLERAPAAERYVLDDTLFASVSALARGVAVLMVVAPLRPAMPPCIEADAVLLDRVQDPGNVGSILRSAAAAGIGDVYLSNGCSGAWSPKVVRAAMGAHFHLRVFEDCDLASLRRTHEVALVATSPHAARSVHEADLCGKVAWLFGHEGQGVDPALMDAATAVRIPQPGAVESLNVAAAAAICFFEQVRQRGERSGINRSHEPTDPSHGVFSMPCVEPYRVVR